MTEIEVTATGTRSFRVVVRDGPSSTAHDVRVPDGYETDVGWTEDRLDTLVEASFRFLLAREPKESIMRSFELPVIARYFPEYTDEIRP